MPDTMLDGFIENGTFDELWVGESASLTHRVARHIRAVLAGRVAA